MNETFIPCLSSNKRKWYLIDCKNQKVGRIATICARILTGKLKSYYHPSFDNGDYVILTNVEFLTLNENTNKFHVYHPGRPRTISKTINKCITPNY